MTDDTTSEIDVTEEKRPKEAEGVVPTEDLPDDVRDGDASEGQGDAPAIEDDNGEAS